MPQPTYWRLRQGADRRIRSGHPWIFSNELSESPKGHSPGAPVVLLDSKGTFLASGYGNPHSLIAFRALNFDSGITDPTTQDFLVDRVLKTWWQRKSLGFETSFRLCYGEGDFCPGLVIDRYLVHQGSEQIQVLAVQILTAGIDRALAQSPGFFQELIEDSVKRNISPFSWGETAVVIRNDVNIRKLEGLQSEAAKIIKAVPGFDLTHAQIEIANGVLMSTDLVEGQKTGFFLDQAYNISLVCNQLKKMTFPEERVRILDLCCYVGQWSSQIAKVLKERGLEVEITVADISETALAFAKINVERQRADVVNVREMDVMKDLGSLPEKYFDVVIADPPAFIKAKKDVPTGRAAYLKLNTGAFKLVRRGGLVVSCSCSGLFEETEMMDVLKKAIQRGESESRCILHGGHSPDHPVLLSFNEGFYLKMFVHQVL